MKVPKKLLAILGVAALLIGALILAGTFTPAITGIMTIPGIDPHTIPGIDPHSLF